MSTLSGEIAKIAAYSSGAEITESDIRAVAIPQLEAGVFDCADAIIRGNNGEACRTFAVLMEIHKDSLRDEAIPMVGAFSWKMRREYQSKLRIGRRSPMLEWSEDAILLCADADARLKSSSGDENAILTGLFTALLAKKAVSRS
jgi:DNA polymerase III delta subunit